VFFLIFRHTSNSPLFPYTTLFRSSRTLGISTNPPPPFPGHSSRPAITAAPTGLSAPERALISATRRRPTTASTISRTPLATSTRSEEHTSELQSLRHLVCRLLLEK